MIFINLEIIPTKDEKQLKDLEGSGLDVSDR